MGKAELMAEMARKALELNGIDHWRAFTWMKEYFTRNPGAKAEVAEYAFEQAVHHILYSVEGRIRQEVQQYDPRKVAERQEELAERQEANLKISGSLKDVYEKAEDFLIQYTVRGIPLGKCTGPMLMKDAYLSQCEQDGWEMRKAFHGELGRKCVVGAVEDNLTNEQIRRLYKKAERKCKEGTVERVACREAVEVEA